MWIPDAANTGFTENNLGAPVVFSHTTGTADILFVWVVWTTTANGIDTVTYNGDAMTLAVSQITNRAVSLYYLLNPDAGTHNVVITPVAAGPLGRVIAGSHSWSGAASSQTPTTITGAGNSLTPSVTVSTASDDLIVDVLGIAFTAGETISVGANQTERGNLTGGASRGVSSTQLGSDGGVMSWTNSIARAYGMVAASFAAAPASTGVPVKVHHMKQQGMS